ncbi:hypothetical protein BY996DRAFT_6414621 [Phakopsora pachyrhizi]|nr:hypothetical protein BY996DRAFT_6414621 [Phakopsora pachyrhizi]
MEASSQDAIFDWEIQVITKEAFLENITVANRHLSPVIYNPSFPSYIQAAPETSSGLESNIITAENTGIANITQTVSNYQLVGIPESHSNPIHNPDSQAPQSLTKIQICSQGEPSNYINHQPTNSNTPSNPINIPSNLTVAPPTSSSIPLNTCHISDLTINNAVTKSTNTLLHHSIPEVQLAVPVSFPSPFIFQHEDVLSATLRNVYHLKTSSWKITFGSILALVKNRNGRIEGIEFLNYLPSGIKIKSDYGTFSSQHLKHLIDVVTRDITAPVKFVPQQVTTENLLSAECALAGFLASSFFFNKNRGTILPMKGCKGNDNTIKDPAPGAFKNLDDLVGKIVHILLASNMVQAHVKSQQIPSAPSSSSCPKRKGKASSSRIDTVPTKALQLVYKEIGLEGPLYCLLMAFCATGVRGLMIGSNNWKKCGALESFQIITLKNEILILKGNNLKTILAKSK